MKAHVALCIFLVGCVADPPALGETESSLKIAPGDGCTSWECGSNSPIIAAVDFWDLSESLNVSNSRGYKVTWFGMRDENTFLALVPDVQNGVLQATLGAHTTTDPAVISKTLWRVVNTADNKTYELVVGGVTSTPWWAPAATDFGGPTPPAVAYHLGWREYLPNWLASPDPVIRKYGPPITPVCGENPEGTGMANFTAVLFDGDWIDADNIKVLGEKANWFNIGCAGHALAKQHLTGMTKASAYRLYRTAPSINQRTASLKMITGDYCGLGHPFTFAGQPLRWNIPDLTAATPYRYKSTKSLLPLGQVQVLEARWNQNGATCLNTPRVDFRQLPDDPGDIYFPETVEELLKTHTQAEIDADPTGETQNWCTATHPRPPPCTGSYNDVVAGTLATSVNYGSWFVPLPL
jgi:ADYC domain